MAVKCLFRILVEGDPRRDRRPDVAFVSYASRPADRELDDADSWDVVPDFAVEILSPTDPTRGLGEKLRDNFAAGVRLVWVIEPALRMGWRYTAFDHGTVLGVNASLDGGDVLPGFAPTLGELLRTPTQK